MIFINILSNSLYGFVITFYEKIIYNIFIDNIDIKIRLIV